MIPRSRVSLFGNVCGGGEETARKFYTDFPDSSQRSQSLPLGERFSLSLSLPFFFFSFFAQSMEHRASSASFSFPVDKSLPRRLQQREGIKFPAFFFRAGSQFRSLLLAWD